MTKDGLIQRQGLQVTSPGLESATAENLMQKNQKIKAVND
jgi:hypothetical protein